MADATITLNCSDGTWSTHPPADSNGVFKAKAKSKLALKLAGGAPANAYGLAIVSPGGAKHGKKSADAFDLSNEGKIEVRDSGGGPYPVSLFCFTPGTGGYYECKEVSAMSDDQQTTGGPKMKVED